MSFDTERNNSYGFVVADGANKIEIKSVEPAYGVTVTSVRTLRVDGKARQRYTKTGVVRGRTNGYKKAIVSLDDGQTTISTTTSKPWHSEIQPDYPRHSQGALQV